MMCPMMKKEEKTPMLKQMTVVMPQSMQMVMLNFCKGSSRV